MPVDRTPVFLGTVAIEPNRWGPPIDGRRSTIDIIDFLPPIESAGFDGVELWEAHYVDVDEAARGLIAPHVAIYNSYVSLDESDPADRRQVADLAEHTTAVGIKFNVGNDPASESAYAERIAQWLPMLGDETRLLCECHEGISIAQDPATAARIFDAAGPASRVQAILHSNEPPDFMRARFDAYGDRIAHVHVNHLPDLPLLRDHIDATATMVELIRSLGFGGGFTIEFAKGVLDPDATPSQILDNAIDDLHTLRQILAS